MSPPSINKTRAYGREGRHGVGPADNIPVRSSVNFGELGWVLCTSSWNLSDWTGPKGVTRSNRKLSNRRGTARRNMSVEIWSADALLYEKSHLKRLHSFSSSCACEAQLRRRSRKWVYYRPPSSRLSVYTDVGWLNVTINQPALTTAIGRPRAWSSPASDGLIEALMTLRRSASDQRVQRVQRSGADKSERKLLDNDH